MAGADEAMQVATAYGAATAKDANSAVATIEALWRRVDDDFNASYLRVAPQMIEVFNTAQSRAAANASAYIPQVLEAGGQTKAVGATIEFDTSRLIGTSGDGYPTESLLYTAVTTAKTEVAKGATTATALDRGREFLALAVGTALADTARAAEKIESFARPTTYFVRMLQPPSCGRCTILAGREYRIRDPFLRHPGCDCRHIPTSEALAGDMTTDPHEYLDSLHTRDELREKYPGETLDEIYRNHGETSLEKVLGSRANAEAYYKFGGDPFQIVNAYRRPYLETVNGKRIYLDGVRTAQRYNRTIKYTTEGTTRRGIAYWQMSRTRNLSAASKQGGRYRRLTAPRLMPETILQISTSRAQTLKLLRQFGWLG